MCLQSILTFFGSHPFLLTSKHVMQGAHNVVIRDSTLYVAQNVCLFITVSMISDMDLLFVKIEVHGHVARGEEGTLLVPQQPNSSALFTGREDVLERLKDHFAPQDQGDGCRKSFLLYGMGGIGKTQICLKFVEEMGGR